MKNIVCLILVVMLVFPGRQARPAAALVIDLPHIIETIIQYVNDLEIAATEIASLVEEELQNVTGFKQLVELIALYDKLSSQYDLLTRKYRHYLRQIQGARHFFSNAQWMTIISYARRLDHGDKDMRLVITTDLSEEEMRALLYEYGLSPYTTDQLRDFFNDADVEMDDMEYLTEDSDAYNVVADKFLNQMQIVNSNYKFLDDEERDRIVAMKDMLDVLEDDTDLATLQTIANFQIAQQEQQRKTMVILNQMLSSFEPMSAFVASNRAETLKKLADRVKWKSDNPIVASDVLPLSKYLE